MPIYLTKPQCMIAAACKLVDGKQDFLKRGIVIVKRGFKKNASIDCSNLVDRDDDKVAKDVDKWWINLNNVKDGTNEYERLEEGHENRLKDTQLDILEKMFGHEVGQANPLRLWEFAQLQVGTWFMPSWMGTIVHLPETVVGKCPTPDSDDEESDDECSREQKKADLLERKIRWTRNAVGEFCASQSDEVEQFLDPKMRFVFQQLDYQIGRKEHYKKRVVELQVQAKEAKERQAAEDKANEIAPNPPADAMEQANELAFKKSCEYVAQNPPAPTWAPVKEGNRQKKLKH